MRRTLIGLCLGFGILSYAVPAQAGEVMCQDDFGHCTVSNDPDSVSCSCDDEGGGGGTGGDEWADLTDEELMQICLDELAFCNFGESDTGEGTSTGTTGVDPDGDDGMDGSTSGVTTIGDETATTQGEGDGDGDGDGDSDGGEAGDGDGDGDSGADSGTASGTGTGPGGDSGTGEDDGEGTGETGGTGTEDGGGGSGHDDEGKGCACHVDARGSAWTGALLLLGLIGVGRRRR